MMPRARMQSSTVVSAMIPKTQVVATATVMIRMRTMMPAMRAQA